MVVQATNGGTTSGGAFALDRRGRGRRLRISALQGRRQRRQRRELVPALDAGAASRACTVARLPFSAPIIPVPGQLPPTPGATPVIGAIVPLYRIETPTYSVVPPVAQYLGLASIGTFHERRGEQALLEGNGAMPAAWARVYGSDGDIKWSGTVAPTFDGSLVGFQAGLDLIGWESAAGHHDRAGLFIDRAGADGDVRGQALGWNDLSVGGVKLNGNQRWRLLDACRPARLVPRRHRHGDLARWRCDVEPRYRHRHRWHRARRLAGRRLSLPPDAGPHRRAAGAIDLATFQLRRCHRPLFDGVVR